MDPVPIMGKIILSTTLLPFNHSIVSNILHGKRILFIMLSKNKITEKPQIVISREGAWSNLSFIYVFMFGIVGWFKECAFIGLVYYII